MPRVNRGFQRQDYSQLLAELNNEEVSRPKIPAQKAASTAVKDTVSIHRRRRSSLMDNRKMKYIISKSTGLIHDRDCPLAKAIPDEDFDMIPDFPELHNFCSQCYFKALIRKALSPSEQKRADAYVSVLRRMGAKAHVIQRLVLGCDTVFYAVDMDRVWLKVNEDKWFLKAADKGCMIFHNSYDRMEDDKRIIKDEFHLQYSDAVSFKTAVMEMTQYSWKNHLRHEREKELNAARNKLRSRLKGVRSYVRIPKLSLRFVYYHYADGADYVRKQADKHKLCYEIISSYICTETGCREYVCRIRHRDNRDFKRILESTGENCIRGMYFDFADFCAARICQETACHSCRRCARWLLPEEPLLMMLRAWTIKDR